MKILAVTFILAFLASCAQMEMHPGSDDQIKTSIIGRWDADNTKMYWEFMGNDEGVHSTLSSTGHLYLDALFNWQLSDGVIHLNHNNELGFGNDASELLVLNSPGNWLYLRNPKTGKVFRLSRKKL